MANIDTSNINSGKKGKPERKALRVDFTPMVDMNMLLITFFMFTTTLSIPQIMQVAMPADKKNPNVMERESQAVTVILGADDKVYYYKGMPDYEDYTSLKETDYKGLRTMLAERNSGNLAKISELRTKRARNEITEAQFDEKSNEIKKSRDGITVFLKPMQESNYRNVVDALDEMQICGIGKYMIVELEESDHFLIENLRRKGTLTAMADIP